MRGSDVLLSLLRGLGLVLVWLGWMAIAWPAVTLLVAVWGVTAVLSGDVRTGLALVVGVLALCVVWWLVARRSARVVMRGLSAWHARVAARRTWGEVVRGLSLDRQDGAAVRAPHLKKVRVK